MGTALNDEEWRDTQSKRFTKGNPNILLFRHEKSEKKKQTKFDF